MSRNGFNERMAASMRLEQAAKSGFEPFAHEGDVIVVRTASVGLATRLFGSAVAIVLLGFCGYSVARLALAAIGVAPLSEPVSTAGMGVGLIFMVGSAAIGAVAAMTAIQPVRELRIDPGTSRVTLTARHPGWTRRRGYALSAMPRPQVRFQPGGGEDSAGYFLTVRLPDGRRIEGNHPALPIDEQRQQAEYWQAKIAALIQAA